MANAAPVLEESSQFLTFNLGDEEYGIPLGMVQEIVGYIPANKVPRTPLWLRGVFNLRGKVLPLIDLRVRFGELASEITKKTCTLICHVNVEGSVVPMGVVVDYVRDVVAITPSEIEPPPLLGTKIKTDFIVGLFKDGQKVRCLLDVERVFSEDELLRASMANSLDASADSSFVEPFESSTQEKTVSASSKSEEVSEGNLLAGEAVDILMPSRDVGFHFFDDE